MKAAVVHDFEKPLSVEDVPVPEPDRGQVLVKLVASGLCHTDIHAARGDWPVKPKLPLIPGHEGIGRVVALGEGVSNVSEGDMVAMPWLGYACGVCRYCISGWETLCPNQQQNGYSKDGGYAEYEAAYASHVNIVPEGIDPAEAAPISCAGVTTYKAIKVAGTRPTENVLIMGVGGLGHLAIQYGKIFGANVIAVDVTEEKLELAKSLGADAVIHGREQNVVEEVKKLGGADVAITLAVARAAMESATAALNPNGRLVLVALPKDNMFPVDVFATTLFGQKIIGSIVGTRQDLAEVLDLHAKGRTKVIYQTRQLDHVNDCFEEILSGSVPARLVFDMRGGRQASEPSRLGRQGS